MIDDDEYGAVDGMRICRENRVLGENLQSATSFTTNPTGPELG
jgi:hypothetical protein